MKKTILIMFLLTLMVIGGCKAPETSICGDGVCSFIEKSKDNCPMDCTAKLPDLAIRLLEIPESVDSQSELKVEYIISNHGSDSAQYDISSELYQSLNGVNQYHQRQTIEGNSIIMPGEDIKGVSNYWIGPEGNYVLSLTINVLNEKDSNLKDNKVVSDLKVVQGSYPEYLIEKDFGERKYHWSRKYKGSTMLKGETGDEITYEASYAYTTAAVTQYNKDITQDFVNIVKNDKSDHSLEKFEGNMIYVKSNRYGDFDEIEVFWPSNDKVLFLRFLIPEDMKQDYVEEMAREYLNKYPSTMNSEMFWECGDGMCNMEIAYVYENQLRNITFPDGSMHSLGVKDIFYVEEDADKSAVIIVDDAEYYASLRDVLYYKGESIEFHHMLTKPISVIDTEKSSLIIGISNEAESKGLINAEVVEMKKRDTLNLTFANITYSVTLYAFNEDYYVMGIDGDTKTFEIAETTPQFLGGIYVDAFNTSLVFKPAEAPQGVVLNLGENYQTCSADCAAPSIHEEPTEESIPEAPTTGSSGGYEVTEEEEVPIQIGSTVVTE